MAQLETTNYQCPNCEAPLHFNSDDGKLNCEFCGSSFEVDVIEKLYADKLAAGQKKEEVVWGEMKTEEWSEEEANALRTYTCSSCGAEIISDDDTIATTCVYCGNPTVLSGRLAGELKPAYIIPFKFKKEDAVKALSNYYKGKRLLPKAFKDKNHIEEIKGVYVPFWLFDATVDAKMVYDGVKTKVYQQGNNRITETSHYRAERSGTLDFEKVPADGSSKMPDEYMDAVEPFNYDELTEFKTAYLPGYLAEKYDVTADDNLERVTSRMVNTAESTLAQTLNYDSYTVSSRDIKFKDQDAKYALLPVWMLSTKWNGKNYLFAMNGQTGRLIGDLPVSNSQAFKWFLGIAVPTFALIELLLMIL